MMATDLRALNLSLQQVVAILNSGPPRTLSVEPGCMKNWRCGWRSCDFAFSEVVEEAGVVDMAIFPMRLAAHIWETQHYQVGP